MSTHVVPVSAPHSLGHTLHRAQIEPAYGAYVMLRIGFVLIPVIFGLDKFTNILTNWEHYLAPWLVTISPFSPHTMMLIIGVVEISAGVMVALKPRIASYVVALWLAGIIVNLVTYPGFYDVALRDFGLLVAALALARLAKTYNPAKGRAGHT